MEVSDELKEKTAPSPIDAPASQGMQLNNLEFRISGLCVCSAIQIHNTGKNQPKHSMVPFEAQKFHSVFFGFADHILMDIEIPQKENCAGKLCIMHYCFNIVLIF